MALVLPVVSLSIVTAADQPNHAAYPEQATTPFPLLLPLSPAPYLEGVADVRLCSIQLDAEPKVCHLGYHAAPLAAAAFEHDVARLQDRSR